MEIKSMINVGWKWEDSFYLKLEEKTEKHSIEDLQCFY